MTRLRQALKSAPATNWAGFQVYYAFPEGEVLGSTGSDLVDAMLAVFRAVTPVMNLCMNIRLL
jgi:hypothetical protein